MFSSQLSSCYHQTTRVSASEVVMPIPRRRPAKPRRYSRTTTLNSWYVSRVPRISVRAHPFAVQEILYQRPDFHDLDILDIQAIDLRQHVGEDERCWQWYFHGQPSFAPDYRRQGTTGAIWRRR